MPAITKCSPSGEIHLTEEQLSALDYLLSFPTSVQTLGGFAGTGKTTCIKTLAAHLPTFKVAAFTGKAASVLRRKGVDASTIHSAIYRATEVIVRDKDGKIVKDKQGRPKIKVVFTRRLRHEIEADGFIIDEASMVGEDIHEALMSYGLPLIYVGDHGQLPPVGSTDFNLMARPDVVLETIHRNAGEIARFASFIRRGNRPLDWRCNKWRTEDQVTFLTPQQQGEMDSSDLSQIICGMNKTRVAWNRGVRDSHGFPPDRPVVGDHVMCLQNNHDMGIYNGMQGVITELDGQEMTFTANDRDYAVCFDPGSFNQAKPVDRRDLRGHPFDFGYCITCHKSQGDEFDNVLVLEEALPAMGPRTLGLHGGK